MSDSKPDKQQTKNRKLHLNKETLKDLSVSESATKDVVGGTAAVPGVSHTCNCGPVPKHL